MKNILSKWNITPEELKQATDAGDIEVEKTLIDFCAYVAKRYNVVELEISAPARADEVSEFLKGRESK